MCRCGAYLVTVSPEEVLGADVLVGVLDALLQRGHVRPVLPVLVPQVVRIDTGTNQARDSRAGSFSVSTSPLLRFLH